MFNKSEQGRRILRSTEIIRTDWLIPALQGYYTQFLPRKCDIC